MFTDPTLKEGDLADPPVSDCSCAYCMNKRRTGFAVSGHASHVSHQLAGGDERHNPENKARLVLRSSVSKEQFEEYVKYPGGHVLSFQAPSGYWYQAGRVGAVAGHFVYCYREKTCAVADYVALLCLPLQGTMPLAYIALSHYKAITADEPGAWTLANIALYVPHSQLPEAIRRVMRPPFYHL